jgi:hypothetical protein
MTIANPRPLSSLKLLVLAASAFAGFTVGTRAANPGALPNTVIIFTEDQRYAEIGGFGAKGFRTPTAPWADDLADTVACRPLTNSARSSRPSYTIW